MKIFLRYFSVLSEPAQEEGAAAAAKGRSIGWCPYDEGDPRRDQWICTIRVPGRCAIRQGAHHKRAVSGPLDVPMPR
jgi:ribosome modulation factor